MQDGSTSAPEYRAEAHRLAAELRRVIEKLALVEAPEDQLARAADAAGVFAEQLDGLPARRWYEPHEGFAESANAGDTKGVAFGLFDHSPIQGLSNPLASPLRLEIQTDEAGESTALGRANFGAAYEGPPGCVHGGILASVFDEVLGFANALTGHPAMTGTLTVRYRRPTPLRQDLIFEAKCEKVEGRKVFTTGTCRVGEQVTAEAEAIFIMVNMEAIREQVRGRAND